jgi:hypothetical protein
VFADGSLVGDHVDMEIRSGLAVPDEVVAAFCDRHGIRRLAVFGSALRDDFRDDSDVDVLVEFQPGACPGYWLSRRWSSSWATCSAARWSCERTRISAVISVTGCGPPHASCMPPPDDDARLRHLIEAAEKATAYAAERDRAALCCGGGGNYTLDIDA